MKAKLDKRCMKRIYYLQFAKVCRQNIECGITVFVSASKQGEGKMRTVYQSSFEEGFYDYQGTGELTCPSLQIFFLAANVGTQSAITNTKLIMIMPILFFMFFTPSSSKFRINSKRL